MLKKILLLFLLCSSLGFAQDDSTRFIRDRSIIALPVVFKLPETGFGGGAAGTASWRFGDSKSSQASIGLTFTQKKQVLAFLPFQVFFNENKYFINADIGWFKYNYLYYGIGENRVEPEKYDVKYPRIKLLASKRISKNSYAGIRFNYEEYNITDVLPGGVLSQRKVPGYDYSRTFGFGPAIVFDTRDSVFYPHKGVFGEVNQMASFEGFIADRTFYQTTADISVYKELTPKLVLANNGYGILSFGRALPFSQMAMLGGAKKMRGLYQGFFRDNNALLFQSELRYVIWRFAGVTGFGAMGILGDTEQLLRFKSPKFSYGAGLRIATKNHLNLRIDYALSPYAKGNLYATIGEAF